MRPETIFWENSTNLAKEDIGLGPFKLQAKMKDYSDKYTISRNLINEGVIQMRNMTGAEAQSIVLYLRNAIDEDVIPSSPQLNAIVTSTSLINGQANDSSRNRTMAANCNEISCFLNDRYNYLGGFAGDADILTIAYTSELYTMQSKIYFYYRNCLLGEIKNSDIGRCVPCTPGRYSLLLNDTECRKCPSGADDCAGSSILLTAGYWRRNKTTDKIYKCNDTDANDQSRCKGGYHSQCESGYMGSLCNQCDFVSGFVRTGSETRMKCAKCLPGGGSSGQEGDDSCSFSMETLCFSLIILPGIFSFRIILHQKSHSDRKTVL